MTFSGRALGVRLGAAGMLAGAAVAAHRLLAGSGDRRRLGRAVRAAESERQTIASRLHDGPIQELAAIGLVVQRARRLLERGDDTEAGLLLGRAADGLQAEIGSLRALMGELRPQVLDAFGLAGALRDEVRQFTRATGIEAGFSDELQRRLPPQAELVLWRTAWLVLDALRQRATGGEPAPAGVHLALAGRPDRATLRILVDGVGGAAPGAESWPGLAAARDLLTAAGGRWTTHPRPGRGVTVEAVGP